MKVTIETVREWIDSAEADQKATGAVALLDQVAKNETLVDVFKGARELDNDIALEWRRHAVASFHVPFGMWSTLVRAVNDKDAFRGLVDNPSVNADMVGAMKAADLKDTEVVEKALNVRMSKAETDADAAAKTAKEAKEKADKEAKAQADADAKATKAEADADAAAKAAKDAKAKADKEAKAQADADAKATKAEADADTAAKAAKDAKDKADEEAKAKADADAVEAVATSTDADARKRVSDATNRVEDWAKSHVLLFGLLIVLATSILNNLWTVAQAAYYGTSSVAGNPYLQLLCFALVVVGVIWTFGTRDLDKKGQVVYSILLVVAGFSAATSFWLQVNGSNSQVAQTQPLVENVQQTDPSSPPAEVSSPAPIIAPRPEVAGKILSDLDFHVFKTENDTVNFAFYGLVYVEMGQQQVNAAELQAVRTWMTQWGHTIPEPNQTAIRSRTEELVRNAGAKELDQEGNIVAKNESDKKAISQVIANLK